MSSGTRTKEGPSKQSSEQSWTCSWSSIFTPQLPLLPDGFGAHSPCTIPMAPGLQRGSCCSTTCLFAPGTSRSASPEAISCVTEECSGPGGQGKRKIKCQYPLEIPGAIKEAEQDYLGNWKVSQDPHRQCHAILIIISGLDLNGWKNLLLLLFPSNVIGFS